MYFHIPERCRSGKVMKAKVMMMIIHDDVCENECKIVCLKEYVIIFYVFFIYIQDCTEFPESFLFTHNANWLKCCCNSLTLILYTPSIDPLASIVLQFQPYFHKYKDLFLIQSYFLFLQLDDIDSGLIVLDVNGFIFVWWIWEMSVSSGVLDVKCVCTVILLALFCTSWEGTEKGTEEMCT